MYTNDHATRLVFLNTEAERIASSMQRTQDKLDWLNDFDSAQSHSSLAQLKREMQASRERQGQLEQLLKSNQAQLDSAQEQAAAGFNPGHWFSTERSVAKRLVETLTVRIKALQRNLIDVCAELVEHGAQEQRLEQDLKRYRSFDPLEAQALMAQLRDEQGQLKLTIEQTRKASERWEAAAGQVSREWQRAKSTLERLERDIAEADAFYEALNQAQSARERAQIHEACARHFGSGNSSPRSLLKDLKYEQRKVTQDADKLQLRLRDVVRLLQNEIGTLIVDGNNLCYAPMENGQRRFIGLVALKALVSHLCATYKVTLVFDPGIRQQLKMDDGALQAAFPNATVVVMNDKAKADEAILAAAEFDESAYVISNDRYADFPEMASVREGRVLTHIIHPRSVQIQQLQINLQY